MPDEVLLTVEDAVARLTLNRPDAGNAFDAALGAAWRARAEEIEARGDVRVVVLAANGPMFCVGGDLAWMRALGDQVEDGLIGLAGDLHAGQLALRRADAPVVAAVQGVAAGAGMSLVCFADIAIAAATAKLTMAYTNAGLSPDGGATWTLPRIVGWRRAAELMLLNERLGADEAAREGIVTRVVPSEELETNVDAIARRLASGPTRAYGATRRLLDASATSTFADQVRREAETIARLAAEPDGREGVAAFLEKRSPEFGLS